MPEAMTPVYHGEYTAFFQQGPPMSSEAPAKPKSESWRDFAEESLPWLTRDELTARLRDDGVDVSARTLAYWESENVLPRPIRRWVAGAPRATYPERAVWAVGYVRRLQAEGLELPRIGPMVRSILRVARGHDAVTAEEQHRNRDLYQPDPEEAEPILAELARRHVRLRGGPPLVRVDVVATDADGHRVTLHSFAPDTGD